MQERKDINPNDKKKKVKYGIVLVLFFGICGVILLWKPLRMDRFSLIPCAIDWVDCIQVEDTKYFNFTYPREEVKVEQIGEMLGKVNFTVEGHVNNPSYVIRNWDATFLRKETKVYQITDTEDAIAVEIEGKYYRYSIIK